MRFILLLSLIVPLFAARADRASLFEVQPYANLSGRIAFGATINGVDEIFMLDLDAHKVRSLVGAPASQPAYSPSGEQIVFFSDRDGFPALFIANWSGQSLSRLTGPDFVPHSYAWAPDGTQLIISGSVKHKPDITNLYSLSVPGGELTQLTQFRGSNTNPSVNPEGRVIAYQTDRFWPGMDVCAWNITQKTENCLLTGSRSFIRPAWSHSGKNLLFISGAVEPSELGRLKLENASRGTLVTTAKQVKDIAWDPDDRYVAFTAEGSTKDVANLFAVDLDDRAFPLVRSAYSIHGLSWNKVKGITLEARRLRALEPAPYPSVKILEAEPMPSLSEPPSLVQELLGREEPAPPPTQEHE